MPPARPRRSALFVPGSNERALEKARGLSVDCLLLDLEDAVAPARKSDARGLVAELLRANAFEGREVVVRINALETGEGVADLEAVLPAAPDAVLLPKVNAAADIEGLCAALDETEARRGMAIWAMIETPKAVLNLPEIASIGARRRLAALVLGANDLSADMRMRLGPERAELAPVLSQLVVAARAHCLTALDSVYNNYADTDGVSREARQARAFGFDGKTLIHPSQIAPVHDAFAPSNEEVDWARKVVAAFQSPENLERGAISIDGKMVERMHCDEAEHVLALAGERLEEAGS